MSASVPTNGSRRLARLTSMQPLTAELLGPEPVELALAGARRRCEVGDLVRLDDSTPPRIAERIAKTDSALARIVALAAGEGLDPAFSEEVEEEARKLEADSGIDDPKLKDYTGLAFVTIDDEHSRDLDQAVQVERRGDGHLVRYALADAAHFVRPGTALHDEALRRGASYYLPSFVVPMLPRRLCEDLISLNPKVDRRALVFEIELDADGLVSDTRVLRARIHSRAKLSFERVQSLYDDRRRGAFRDRDVQESLLALEEVGRRRQALAAERGVVRYRRQELDVSLKGAESPRFVAGSELRLGVERHNEQVSLLCNIEGARLLRAHDRGDDDAMQPIYRTHAPPEEGKLRRFTSLLGRVRRERRLDPKVWTWRRREGQSLSDFLAALPHDGEEGRVAKAINRQALMTNGRSTFGTLPADHFGVGAEVYARFSAPMREIVGVFLHAELLESLDRRRRKRKPTRADVALQERVVEIANQSKDLQRKLTRAANRLVLDDVLGHLGRDRLVGTVMGLTRSKVHVLLDDPPLDVKAYRRDLERGGRKCRLARSGVALLDARGRRVLALGDRVSVGVAGRDAQRDRWRLSVRRAKSTD
ncbi:MAG: RNB domain-containing ribonuclease [Acidobacteriota bacterium]